MHSMKNIQSQEGVYDELGGNQKMTVFSWDKSNLIDNLMQKNDVLRKIWAISQL